MVWHGACCIVYYFIVISEPAGEAMLLPGHDDEGYCHPIRNEHKRYRHFLLPFIRILSSFSEHHLPYSDALYIGTHARN